MEPVFTIKDLKKRFFNPAAKLQSTILKCCVAICVLLILSYSGLNAQAPTVQYNSPAAFTQGAPITPVTPTSSGVAALAYKPPVALGTGINQPSGVTTDAAGNIYIADTYNNAVKKIPVTGGPLITLGSGFIQPYGLAIDGSGNIYVADYGNNAIKEIPVAGGPPVVLGSGFNQPTGVAVDPAGDVFVADASNNAVKEIPVGGSSVITLGSGFKTPMDIALDAAGNIFVADEGNGMVKKIPADGGSIIILASGLKTPRGLALDASDNVYVADPGNAAVYKIPASGAPMTTYGTGFGLPFAVATDTHGNLYVADPGDNNVDEVTAGGANTATLVSGFRTVFGVAVDSKGNVYVPDVGNNSVKELPAGGGAAITLATGLPVDQGIAVDKAGNVFVDCTDSTIRKIPAGGGAVSTFLNLSLYFPGGMVLDSLNNIYVTARNYVLKLSPPQYLTNNTVFLNGTTPFSGPAGVALDNAGNIFAADVGNNAVKEILANGGQINTIGTGFKNPVGVAVDPGGNVYVSDSGNKQIKIVTTGSSVPIVLASGFNQLYGMALDDSNNLYVADAGTNLVEKIMPAGGYFITPSLPAGLSFDSTTGIISGTPTVTIPLTSYTITAYNSFGSSTAKVSIKINAPTPPVVSYKSPATFYTQAVNEPLLPKSTGVNSLVYNSPVTFSSGWVNELVADSAGNFYVSLEYGNQVSKYDSNGNFIPLGVNLNGVGQIDGLNVDRAGNIYISDIKNRQIVEYFANGNAPLILKSGIAYQSSVGLDAAGNVYFVGTTGNINRIAAGGGPADEVASGFNGINCIHVDPAGNIYVSDLSGFTEVFKDKTRKFYGGVPPTSIAVDPTGNIYLTYFNTGTVIKIPAGGDPSVNVAPGFNYPLRVACDAAGDVFVVESNVNDIKKITPAGGYYITSTLPAGLAFNNTTGAVSGTPVAISQPEDFTVLGYNYVGATAATLNLQVLPPPDLNLTSLKVGGGSHLSPSFWPAITSYTDTVIYNHLAITITPTASDPLATITVNGTAVASGATSASIPLSEGSNTITTVVTAADGVTTKTYTITFFRAYSSDANLKAMQPTAGVMSPVFTPAITSYTATVNFTNLGMHITPVAQDSLAAIKVNGVTVASGSISQLIQLNEGPNTITTVVTAPDGITTKTFTIAVFRRYSANPDLSWLQASSGPISPAFSPAITNYTGEVAHSIGLIKIAPFVTDPLATITVNGVTVASGTRSQAMPLVVGPNAFTIIVTAPDGTTTQTYTLTVTRDLATPGPLNAAYQPIGFEVATIRQPGLTDDGLLVHQGLSPNGDGVNDFLVIENIDQYPDNKLSIMNRNGQLVYQASGYDNSSKVFDGHSNKNGQMQLPGTYFYQLDYTVKGIIKHKTGFLVLKY